MSLRTLSLHGCVAHPRVIGGIDYRSPLLAERHGPVVPTSQEEAKPRQTSCRLLSPSAWSAAGLLRCGVRGHLATTAMRPVPGACMVLPPGNRVRLTLSARGLRSGVRRRSARSGRRQLVRSSCPGKSALVGDASRVVVKSRCCVSFGADSGVNCRIIAYSGKMFQVFVKTATALRNLDGRLRRKTPIEKPAWRAAIT